MSDEVIVTGLVPGPLDVAALVAPMRRPECGGLVVFEGTVRSPDRGREVVRLEYEAYESRATAQLRALAQGVARRFGLGAALAVHRLGPVPVGEPAVAVAAAGVHRSEAFAAAQALLEGVKAEAAVWKKEVFADGATRWAGLPHPCPSGQDRGQEAFS